MKKESGQYVAHRIRDFRKANKLTQKDLAEAIGVSKSAVTQWELNKNKVNQTHADMLCDFFGVDNPAMFYIPSRVDRVKSLTHLKE
jgi:transcriptional regulator with XRE-family HTH domain